MRGFGLVVVPGVAPTAVAFGDTLWLAEAGVH